MKEHYCLTDEEYELLLKEVTVADLIKERHKFRIRTDKECRVGGIALMCYIDEYGDFNEGYESKHKRIAKAVYNSMGSHAKVEILQYIEDYKNNFEIDEEQELDEPKKNYYDGVEEFNWRV